jgi:pimeloyl-ACP methyl ester carboxylesterase
VCQNSRKHFKKFFGICFLLQDFEEHYIEGCSHWVQMERPDEVNKAIEKYLATREF